MMNVKEKMTWTIMEERKVLTESLHATPEIHQLFQQYKYEQIARDLGTYKKEDCAGVL